MLSTTEARYADAHSSATAEAASLIARHAAPRSDGIPAQHCVRPLNSPLQPYAIDGSEMARQFDTETMLDNRTVSVATLMQFSRLDSD